MLLVFNRLLAQWGITAAETLNVVFPISFSVAVFTICQGDLNSNRGDRMTYDEKRINLWTTSGFTYNNPCAQRSWIALGK